MLDFEDVRKGTLVQWTNSLIRFKGTIVEEWEEHGEYEVEITHVFIPEPIYVSCSKKYGNGSFVKIDWPRNKPDTYMIYPDTEEVEKMSSSSLSWSEGGEVGFKGKVIETCPPYQGGENYDAVVEVYEIKLPFTKRWLSLETLKKTAVYGDQEIKRAR